MRVYIKEIRNATIWATAWLVLGLLATPFLPTAQAESAAEKVVVLTFDDAVKNHRTFVAPFLEELGFGASFFVTHCWMIESPDPYASPGEYMTWQEIAEIHQMGFEIGNHSWTHSPFAVPRDAARLTGELALVEHALAKVGVPRPVSYAHTGNQFGPEALEVLKEAGYKFARRGVGPEVQAGTGQLGPLYDPRKHHRLLIPTTGVTGPNLDAFKQMVGQAGKNRIVVSQFHGIPDPHERAGSPRELFKQCMNYLKEQNFKVIALKDVAEYLPAEEPEDPLLEVRFLSGFPESRVVLPTEVISTREDLNFWLANMLDHRYTWEEISQVTGYSVDEAKKFVADARIDTSPPPLRSGESLRVLPYPGGRHPRTGFLEGAMDPQRGTKASIFLPGDPESYVVVDLPEAVFINNRLAFLAHTHIPTMWTEKNRWLENVDWSRSADGGLTRRQTLPNGVTIGSSLRPAQKYVDMEVWVRNGSTEELTGLRAMVCVMLKGARGFDRQTHDNKVLRDRVAVVKAATGDKWIMTAWEHGRTWENPPVPCMHSDPMFPDCPVGETVKVKGRLWFHEGNNMEAEMNRAEEQFGK